MLFAVIPSLFAAHVSLKRQYTIERSRQTPKSNRSANAEGFYKLSKEKFKGKKLTVKGHFQPPRKAKSTSSCDLPAEWQNISLMHWGGQVVEENGNEISLRNTCTVDNFLWITYCWYLSNPEALDFHSIR